MRSLILALLAAAAANAQLVVPPLVQFPADTLCDVSQGGNGIIETSFRIASKSGTVQFQTNPGPSGWLQVKPQSGTVGTAGTAITLGVDTSRARRGYQESWMAVRAGQFYWVVFVGVNCVPSPS